jgi:tetratricopeptide (TPR) repeat protein
MKTVNQFVSEHLVPGLALILLLVGCQYKQDNISHPGALHPVKGTNLAMTRIPAPVRKPVALDPDQISGDEAYAVGNLDVAEAKYSSLAAKGKAFDEDYRRLSLLLEAKGNYDESAKTYSHLLLDNVKKFGMTTFTPDPKLTYHYKELLSRVGPAAVAAGFDSVRDLEWFKFRNEPLQWIGEPKSAQALTSYSLRDLNAMGLTDEDVVDFIHAQGLDPMNPSEYDEIQRILNRVVAHSPHFYPAWEALEIRTHPMDAFEVVRREYLVSDPAHRLAMKKFYVMDWDKLDREVNPAP